MAVSQGFDSQQKELEARSSSLAVPTDDFMQAGDNRGNHSTSADAEPALASAQRSVPASLTAGRQGVALSCNLHEPCQQAVPMPEAAAGSSEANLVGTVVNAHTHSSCADAQAVHTMVVNGKCDASESKSPETPFGETGDHVMMGKRKRARKSTKSTCQPTASTQQSNANLAEGAVGMPDTSHVYVIDDDDCGSAQDNSSSKPSVDNAIIDITDD